MPSAGAAMIGGSVAGSLVSGLIQADTIGRASSATLNQQRQDRDLALRYAEPSTQELQQLEQSIAVNSQDIARKTKLLASADPALIEAGHQALQMLKGQEASTLAPIRNQRAQQRSQLQATLAQQLGPDFANSTAGSQALNQFDSQTNDLVATQQDRSLAQLLGVAQNTSAGNQLMSNVTANTSIAGQYGNINARRINAITGNRIDPALGYQGEIARNAQAGNLFNTATTLGTAYMMGGGDLFGTGGSNGSVGNTNILGNGQGSYTNANYTMPRGRLFQ